MKKIIFAVAAWALFMGQGAADPKSKISLCHFDEEEGAWVLISISATAANAHANNHDDGAPGGLTIESKTRLDANCEVVAGLADDPE